jgi:hypothetical protein
MVEQQEHPNEAVGVDGARKLDSSGARKVNTQRLESDHFGGLGVDPQACRGGGTEGEDRGEVVVGSPESSPVFV